MKKKYLMLAFLLINSSNLMAQTMRLGIKGGLNYSNITGETPTFSDYDRSHLLGFQAGIFTHIPVSGMVAIQPELTYSTKGYKIADERTNGNAKIETDVTHKINYLDFPLLVQVNSGNIYFEAGPQVSFLLNREYKQYQKTTTSGLLDDNVIENRSPTKTSTTGYRQADLGLAVGIGFQAPESPLSLNFRYTTGQGSLYDDKNIDNRHSVFQVSLSTWLPLGK